MLSTKIKVGDKVAVYIEHLSKPEEHKLSGGRVGQGQAQIRPGRSIPTNGISERYLVEATVVEKGATRYEANRGYGAFWTKKDDGILVEFDTPVAVGNHGVKKTLVSRAVVTAKFITDKWENVLARQEAQAAAKVAQAQRNEEAAVTFGQKLSELGDQLDAIGLGCQLHDDVSGIYGKGYSVSLNSALVQGGRLPVGYGSSRMQVDTALFTKLVAIAAKHGEVIA